MKRWRLRFKTLRFGSVFGSDFLGFEPLGRFWGSSVCSPLGPRSLFPGLVAFPPAFSGWRTGSEARVEVPWGAGGGGLAERGLSDVGGLRAKTRLSSCDF